MKSLQKSLKVKHFQLTQKRQQVAQLENMIKELNDKKDLLLDAIEKEQNATGISNPASFAYSTFAKATHERAEKIDGSVANLREQLNVLRFELNQAFADYKKLEIAEKASQAQIERQLIAKEQAELDEISHSNFIFK